MKKTIKLNWTDKYYSVAAYQRKITETLDQAFDEVVNYIPGLMYSSPIKSYSTESVYDLLIRNHVPYVLRFSEHHSSVKFESISPNSFDSREEFIQDYQQRLRELQSDQNNWLTYAMVIVLAYLNRRMPMGDRIVADASGQWALFKNTDMTILPDEIQEAIQQLIDYRLCYYTQDNGVLYSRMLAIDLLKEYYQIRTTLIGVTDPPTSLMMIPDSELFSLITNQHQLSMSGGND